MLFAFTEILIQALMETSRQKMKELSGDITGGRSNRGKSHGLLIDLNMTSIFVHSSCLEL